MDSNVPVLVVTPGVADRLWVGSGTSCLRQTDGAFLCWGDNQSGQLGTGNTNDAGLPIPAPTVANAIEHVPSGYALGGPTGGQICARRSDGTVACVGDNAFGQLGTGNFANQSAPKDIPGLTGVVELTLGRYHACARRDDGTVWCWGGNDYGQVGAGVAGNQPSPVQVIGLGNIVHIDAGGWHTCALADDGSLSCWGRNHFGQLGAPVGDSGVPVPSQPVCAP
jgi:alpha-tubulin suppressor-like RCC1 family protein